LRSWWEKGIKLEDAKEDLQTLFPKRVYIFHHYVTLKGQEAGMQTKSTNNQAQI
jgi:hypothetical protein